MAQEAATADDLPAPPRRRRRLLALQHLARLRLPAVPGRRRLKLPAGIWPWRVAGWPVRRVGLAAALAAAATVAGLVTALSLLGTGDGTSETAALELPDPATAAPPSPTAGIDGGITVPPYTAASFAGMPVLLAAKTEPLPPAPDPALLETVPEGMLPRLADDGRRPWQVYARPFDRADDRARLVIIVLDVGLSRAASEAAIRRLPGAVVLAIDAYATAPESWARTARAAGHEVLATVPLQAAHGSGADAGPRALLVAADFPENTRRLQAGLARFPGYAGVLLHGGSAFGDGLAGLAPLLATLHARGLLLVDGTAGEAAPLLRAAEQIGLPRAHVDMLIEAGDAAAIDRQLEALAAAARERRVAVAAIRPAPMALERLRGFIDGLDSSRYVLAPVSAVVAGGAG